MYTIENKKFYTAEDVALYITENIDDIYYSDMLDECYEVINICGIAWSPSDALEKLDPIAYRCGYLDYCDDLYYDIVYDIKHMSDGDTLTEYNFEIAYTED